MPDQTAASWLRSSAAREILRPFIGIDGPGSTEEEVRQARVDSALDALADALPVQPQQGVMVTEPVERIQAAIERCRRFEEERGLEAAPRRPTDNPPGVFQARGEVQAATYLRELLEQPLPVLDTSFGAFLAIFDRRMAAGEFVGDEELIDARHEVAPVPATASQPPLVEGDEEDGHPGIGLPEPASAATWRVRASRERDSKELYADDRDRLQDAIRTALARSFWIDNEEARKFLLGALDVEPQDTPAPKCECDGYSHPDWNGCPIHGTHGPGYDQPQPVTTGGEDGGEQAMVVMSDEDRERLRGLAGALEGLDLKPGEGLRTGDIAFVHHLADASPALWAAEVDQKLVRDHLDCHGMEAVEVGTKALLEALTEVCPVCEGDNSGGGIDEPAYSCDHCESRTRIPRGRDSLLTKEQCRDKLNAVGVHEIAPLDRFDLGGEEWIWVKEAIADAAFGGTHPQQSSLVDEEGREQ